MKIILKEDYFNLRYTSHKYDKGEILEVNECDNLDFYIHTVKLSDIVIVNLIKKELCDEIR